MPGGLSTLENSVTGFPSMANSFSFVVGVSVAVSSITGMQRGVGHCPNWVSSRIFCLGGGRLCAKINCV